jgi:hypothetical protein
MRTRASKKRSVFEELMEGVSAMGADREGRITLRSHQIGPLSQPMVDRRVVRSTSGQGRFPRRGKPGGD